MEESQHQNSYIVSYDIKGSEDYTPLIEHIKGYGNWAHITESTWAILTSRTAVEVRDDILSLLPAGSRLFVVKSANIAAWSNVLCSNEWLKKNV